jgi:hypothetical protein
MEKKEVWFFIGRRELQLTSSLSAKDILMFI